MSLKNARQGYGPRSGTNLTKAGSTAPTAGLLTTAQTGSKSGDPEGAGPGDRDPSRNDGIFMNILSENRGPQDGQMMVGGDPLRGVQFDPN